MSKKGNLDRSCVLSKEKFDKFIKINESNFDDFYNEDTIFIIVVDVKTKDGFKVTSSFVLFSRFIKGTHTSYHLWSNELLEVKTKITSTESIFDYNQRKENLKSILKLFLKKEQLYGRKFK
jgi:hypothetical protein